MPTLLRAALVLLFLAASPASAQSAPTLFSDDFRGVSTRMPDGQQKLYPDPNLWAFTFWPGIKWPDSYGDGTNWLESNAESQTYLSPMITSVLGTAIPPNLRYDPFRIESDGLHIRASTLSAAQQSAYHVGGHRRFGSGILVSRTSFLYGRLRLTAKLPGNVGTWPAFWLLPESHVWPPEIDALEGMAWGRHAKQMHVGIISDRGTTSNHLAWINLPTSPANGFHEYGLDWNPSSITFLFDGKPVGSFPTPADMHQPMYLLINLAVGGKWPCNEMGIRPIDSVAPSRLSRCADKIALSMPADMILRQVTVESLMP